MISVHRPQFAPHTSRKLQGCCHQPINSRLKSQIYINSDENIVNFVKELHQKQEILGIFCQLLKNVMRNNANSSQNPSIFDIKGKASITIEDFISRIFEYMEYSEGCLIAAVILLDRIQTYHRELTLSESNIHKLIMSAILIAAKYCEDNIFNNSYLSKVAGLTLAEVNSLEIQFLVRINFQVYIDPKVYDQYNDKLEAYLEKKRKGKRIQQY